MRIEIRNLDIHLIRKPIKHLYIRISRHTGEISVSAPNHFPLELIKHHLSIKYEWIETQRRRALTKILTKRTNTPEINPTQAKTVMTTQLNRLIPKWEDILNVKVNAFTIRAMTTRWGSCNTLKKRISINLNLIHKSQACLEYVVLHELIHLIEANHSKRFYALMEKHMPEWKTIQAELEAQHIMVGDQALLSSS